MLSCCTSLRAIKVCHVGHADEPWFGGNLSSLAALTKLARLEMRHGWFGTATVTELGVLTSLQSLWLPGSKFLEALPVMQQLPRLRHVVIPASTLCGKCFAGQQADIVALSLKCSRGFEVFDDEFEIDEDEFEDEDEDEFEEEGGCEHFPEDLQTCLMHFARPERQQQGRQHAPLPRTRPQSWQCPRTPPPEQPWARPWSETVVRSSCAVVHSRGTDAAAEKTATAARD